MENKKDRNLNITIASPEKDEDEVVVSFSTVIKKLKKYVSLWIAAAIVAALLSGVYAVINTNVRKATLSALISFSYSGIEKGLDPAGKKFDPYSLKNPTVIRDSLEDLDLDLDQLEFVRRGIRLKGITPKDAADRIALYESILDKNGGNTSVEKILETSYYPTQYYVYFDYNETTLSDSEAVDLFNKILENYDDYFYQTYGYNNAIGNALTSINYEDYDYSEAIDVFTDSLNSLRTYVRQLANEDTTMFRSSVTGYTFNDLSESIRTVRDIDLDKASSYINTNNLTKDKEAALAYCEYRIKDLNRTKAQLEEEFNAYNAAIEAYQKDDIIIFGAAGDNTTTQSTVTSAQYDKMFNDRNKITNDLADTKRRINFYKERQEILNSKSAGAAAKAQKVEAQLAAISEKITYLVDLVSKTSEDYYVNVTFKNAYAILVPASNTASDKAARIVENTKAPLIVLETLVLVAFFGLAFVEALITDSKKKKNALAAAKADADGEEDTEPDETDSEEQTSEKAKENEGSAADKKKNKKK